MCEVAPRELTPFDNKLLAFEAADKSRVVATALTVLCCRYYFRSASPHSPLFLISSVLSMSSVFLCSEDCFTDNRALVHLMKFLWSIYYYSAAVETTL